jgi:hypothetical protein
VALGIVGDGGRGAQFGSVEVGRFTCPSAALSWNSRLTPVGKTESCAAIRLIEFGLRRSMFGSIRGHNFEGRAMATIPMIPIGPVTTLNRTIILTERGISGSGGDDFICGHCGSLILEDYDPSTVRGNPAYQCGFCENNNDLPFAASDRRHWPSR